MPRRVRITVIVIAAFAFVALSLLLARALTATGAERALVREVLAAQARGDADAVLADLPECRREPACVTTTRARTARLRRGGDLEILAYRPSVGLSLTRQSGIARAAWRAGEELPVVQCVRVRREGPLTGGGVTLLALSDPIGRTSACSR